jgi:alpha-1,2-mannosyltransferase
MPLPTSSLPLRRALLALAMLVHVVPPLVFLKVFPVVLQTGADFAAYYFATQQAADGGSPYDWPALIQRAATPVTPYLYPPPFLLAMSWSLPLTLQQAYLVMLVLNEALLLSALYLLRRAFRVAWWVPVLLLGTFFPSWDNLLWGQANLIILVPVLGAIALAASRPAAAGALIGLAMMLKPSPVILLLFWMLRGQVRPLLAALAACVALTLLSLPLVGPAQQIAYYTSWLPGLGLGENPEQHAALNVAENHSIAALLSHLWPGPVATQPSQIAQWLRLALGGVLLGGWWVSTRRLRQPQPVMAALLGAATLLPVYAWEHHLLLLFPAVALASRSRSGGRFWLAYACIAWPLGLLMESGVTLLQPAFFQAATPWMSLTKLAGVLGVVALCVRGAAHAEDAAIAEDAAVT